MQASYKVIIYYGSCKLGLMSRLDTRYPILNVIIQTFNFEKKRTYNSITTVIHICIYLQMHFFYKNSSNLSKKTPIACLKVDKLGGVLRNLPFNAIG